MKYFFTVLFVSFLFFNVSLAQMELVKDFDDSPVSSFNPTGYDRTITKVNNKVLFKKNENFGNETEIQLWATDGSEAGAIKLLSVPFSDEEFIPVFYDFTEISATEIAFVARYTDTLFQVWITDGTTGNSRAIATEKKYISSLEKISAGIFYSTEEADPGNAKILKKVDLTASEVSTIYEFHWFVDVLGMSKTDENTLIILAPGANDNIIKLFKSDGTESGTEVIEEIYSGDIVSQQTLMTKAGNKVFFFFKEPGTDCCNYLYVTDGTAEGTERLGEFNIVANLNYETTGSAVVNNNKFYFMAVNSGESINNDRALWVSDGTIAGTYALHNTANFNRPSDLTVFNNSLYFRAFSGISYDYFLYRSDGTVAGTERVQVQYNNNNVGMVDYITVYDSELFFTGSTFETGKEIFSYAGSGTGVTLFDLVPGSESPNPSHLYSVNGELLFFAESDETGFELFKLSPVSAIKAFDEGLAAKIYPNPTKGQFYINGKIISVQIFNMDGKLMLETENNAVNIGEIENGIYTLKVELESGDLLIEKLVLNK